MVHQKSALEPPLSAVNATPSPMPCRWQRSLGSALRLRHFGNDGVLFNPESGSTHLVNDLVLDILDALAQEPADSLELTRRLQLQADEDGIILELERILQNLDQLGLIIPVDM